MTTIVAGLVGLAATAPLFGLLWLWHKHPQRRRPVALLQALGAVATSVVAFFIVGAVADLGTASSAMLTPLIIAGAAVAAVLNRMVNQQAGNRGEKSR